MAILLIFKAFFGSIFGFLFKDWRITLMIVIVAVCGFFAYKYHGVQAKLEVEQQNNIVLRTNLAIAAKVNADNDVLIKQAALDNVQTTAAISKLNSDIQQRNDTVTTLKVKLSKVITPPQKLSPRIAIAVEGIQELRDQAEGIVK
jgi:hypothetical protein